MGVSFAEDRDEAKDVALKPEALAVSLDHPLGSKFGSAIERRLHRKWGILGRRKDVRLAVDRTRGREGDSLAAIGAHRLQHVECGDGVLLKVALWMLRPKADIGVGGQMEDERGVPHRARQCFRVQQVAFDKAEVCVRQGPLEKLLPAGRQIVVTDDSMAIRQETIGQMASDEAGGSGDEIGHQVTRRSISSLSGDAGCQSPIKKMPLTAPVTIRTTPHAIDIASVSFIVRLLAAPNVLVIAISRPPNPM